MKRIEREEPLRFLIAIGLLALSLSGPVHAGGSAPAGKATYDKKCKTCHGVDGIAKPALAKMLKVTMRDLGSKEVQGKSDEGLKKDVVEGTGKMKPVKGLSDKEIEAVIGFIRSLAKR